MAKTKVTHAPFDQKGNLIPYLSKSEIADGYTGWGSYRREIEMRENKPFWAEMTLVGYSRGRSAATFEWKDAHGHEYPMFMTDIVDLLQSGAVIQGGAANLHWMVAKRGSNYGIRVAKPEEVE
jgi:hypothetical protein